MANQTNTRGDEMYPMHTGSVLLDIAHVQRNEIIENARRSRRATIAQRSRADVTPDPRPPKRPRWWGLARNHRAA